MEFYSSLFLHEPKLKRVLFEAHVARARAFQATGGLVTDGLAALAGGIRRGVERVARLNRERRTRAALERLSDRALKDIGVVRGDIGQIARRSSDPSSEGAEGSLWAERIERPEVRIAADFNRGPRLSGPAANDATGRTAKSA